VAIPVVLIGGAQDGRRFVYDADHPPAMLVFPTPPDLGALTRIDAEAVLPVEFGTIIYVPDGARDRSGDHRYLIRR